MKKFLLPIFTCLMLAAPAVQAWSWKECFQKPDKFYTEHILSKKERPTQATIDEFYDHKEKMGIDRFVILKKALFKKSHPNAQYITAANTRNELFSSTVTINEQLFQDRFSEGRAWKNSIDQMHELLHVQKNHGGKTALKNNLQQSVVYAALLTCGRYLSKSPSTSLAGSLLKGIGVLGTGTVFYKVTQPTQKSSPEEKQRWEYEAEVGARNAAAQCGYCDVLEKALKETEQEAKHKNKDYVNTHRPNGIYPTLAETISMERTALAQCRAQKLLKKA